MENAINAVYYSTALLFHCPLFHCPSLRTLDQCRQHFADDFEFLP